jgi:hypothetical protein
MKPTLLLRIAATCMSLHTVGHSFGALTWKDAPNATIGQVIQSMQTNHFEFMGRSATIANFYEGYGITMIFVLLLVSVLLWLLANATANPLTSKLVPLLGVFLILLAIIEYIYFFPLPAAFSLLAGVCTLLCIRRNSFNNSKTS